MKKIIILLIVGAFTSIVMANEKKKKSPMSIGIVNGSNGMVFPSGKTGFIMKYKHFKRDDLFSGTEKVENANPDRKMAVDHISMILRQGLPFGFDIRVVIPYQQKNMKVKKLKVDGTIMKRNFDGIGVGDLRLFTRYQILNQKKKAPFFLMVGAGIKLPTGSTNEKLDGQLLPMGVQSGSGSIDYIGEIGITKILRRHRIDVYGSYTYKTNGDNEFRFGNMLNYDVGYSFAVSKFFDLGLEFNGKTTGKNSGEGVNYSLGGNKIALSPGGRTELAITPGVHIKMSKDLHLSFAVPYYFYQNVNGEQPVGKYEVVTRFGVQF